ncbi:polyhydroxyalkanoate depolymerase [Paraburkholderia sp. BL10I2N1]|uniref:polyhydroxyalkanoate depolymerase n=1 Tax=Paraburkholderia sp. BL10I2N1 TaxID=1938796 RepID=UPI0010622202|nr:polyhydroxyalkanoate depolymerase [Paraburkholderia sp. BL10I2N1]TDN67288.1 poly(3-hydroxybutyrate) depolymerase [Paraburkholderia sp. BL10I2N1]
MLYPFVEYQRALLAPLTVWAAGITNAWIDPDSPFSHLPGAPCLAAGCDLFYRLAVTCGKPAFGITAVEHDGRTIPVTEQVALEGPFCRLLRFARDLAASGATAGQEPQAVVLVCAPLAGHHAVLLREVVETLLPAHDVYVTDWTDARHVPVAEGPFHLDDDVYQLQAFIRHIGTRHLHVLAVCQATVPALAAISLLATAGEPVPVSLILMGGPIDARRSPTAIDRLAARQPLAWFQQNLIHAVPPPYPGAGRRVYPGFLQHAGLVAANPDRLVGSHWDCFIDLLRGDIGRAEAHRRVCDEYNAVLDMPAEFYLDTIQAVFQEFRLARGHWSVRGRPVRPQDIHATALLTIEGELDDISGRGQTHAAHDLCPGIDARDRRHVMVRQCGHYDLFSGPHWRTEVYPAIHDLIRQYAFDGASRVEPVGGRWMERNAN